MAEDPRFEFAESEVDLQQGWSVYTSGVTFTFYHPSEVRAMSVVTVDNPTYVTDFGEPTSGGLHDRRMGPMSDTSSGGQYLEDCCLTCGLNFYYCPGHFGRLELPFPVINPVCYEPVMKLLRTCCVACRHVRLSEETQALLRAEFRALEAGLVAEPPDLVKMIEESDDKPTASSGRVHITSSLLERKRKLQTQFWKQAANGKCPFCERVNPKFLLVAGRFMAEKAKRYAGKKQTGDIHDFEAAGEDENTERSLDLLSRELFTPSVIRSFLRQVWAKDWKTLKRLFPFLDGLDPKVWVHPTDALFVEVLPVPPPKVRPMSFTNGGSSAHATTETLRNVLLAIQNVLRVTKDLKEKGKEGCGPLEAAFFELQSSVNRVYDREFPGLRRLPGDKTSVVVGLKQMLEKKEGLFRMYMMGKRVDFAARSVITPDPLIGVEEVGIPFNFATKLTFPTPVTQFNLERMRQAVMNGPETYPGAEMVEMEDGRKILLRNCSIEERKALAAELAVRSVSYKKARGNKIVHRHMTSGDMVLVNRQPSLHRASIMAHKVRVLTSTRNTLRLHYANCKAYNADFDGDEMNVHFPQSYAARSEAQFISNVGNQYLVPKDGTPLSGLIQDHVIAGVRLTIRGKFLTKEEYSQLVYSALGRALRGKPIKTLPPAILKPEVLWTGKQVISTVLINLTPPDTPALTMESKSKLKEDSFKTASGSCLLGTRGLGESEVGIYSGHLLHGVFDKNQLGSTPLSVVHAYYELFGSEYSCALLSALSALLTCFLSWEAFSLGVHDILVNDEANKQRRRVLKSASKIGLKAVADVLEFKEDVETAEGTGKLLSAFQAKYFSQERNILLQRMDMTFKRCLDTFVNEVQSVCMGRGGLVKSFPENNLLFMVDTGAKGSRVNALQMSCLLGQMELEGRRPGLMISGRTLPSFVLFDPSPRAGGFIAGRYMTGIGPQELFFHCMAGREGLVDTAVKTSRSGYLQRSLVKHLESVHVSYDSTVRDADETVIQFLYGEDGMEVGKTPYLANTKSLEIFDVNAMVQKEAEKAVKLRDRYTDVEKLDAKLKEVRDYMKFLKNKSVPKTGKSNARRIALSPFCHFFAERQAKMKKGTSVKFSPERVKSDAVAAWHKLGDFDKARFVEIACGGHAPDPVVAEFSPSAHFGSITERLDSLIESYIHKQGLRREDATVFRDRLYLKAMGSQVNPGEAVGIVAAQSIGEPSTQMTLNTFHFAGRGEVNVTLGIPRLREILMTASPNIKTPTMEVPSSITDDAARDASLDKLKAHFNRLTLADVLEKFEITEELDLPSAVEKWVYRIRVCILPQRYFRDIKSKTIVDVFDFVEKKFLSRVLKEIWSKAGVKKTLMDTDKNKKKVRDSVYDEEDAGVHAWRNVGGDDDDDAGPTSSKKLMGDDDDLADAWDEREGVNGNDDERDATEARLAARDDDEQGEFEPEADDEDELAGVVDVEGENMINEDLLNQSNVEVDDDESGAKQAVKDEEARALGSSSTSLSWRKAKKTINREYEARRKKVLSLHPCILDYDVDQDDLKWCEFTFSLEVNLKRVDVAEVCRAIAEKSVLHEIRGITKAVVVSSSDGEPWLKTEGINFAGLYAFGEELDLNRIRCNSIHDMAAIYGIEAAARTIVMELENVFKVYGIEVDRRHLTLVADYMTVNGSIRGYNRRGLEYSPSPLQKITFETATGFLKSAVINAERDALSSVSSSLVFGRHSRIGTGASAAIYSLKLQERLMAGLR